MTVGDDMTDLYLGSCGQLLWGNLAVLLEAVAPYGGLEGLVQ